MEKIVEGKSCKAMYNAEKKYIVYSFFGYADVSEHKEMYMTAMEFLQPTVE